MRLFLLVVFSTLMTACISISSDDDGVTNAEGQTVNAETLTLNGFWDGQLDQAGSLRILMYQGIIFGLDESRGYYGSINLDSSTQIANLDLTAYAITASDATAGHYLADGSSVDYLMEGLVYTTASTSDTLVGDYDSDRGAGSFLLMDDATWNNNAGVALVTGQWQAGDYSLYITSLGSRASLKAISAASGGCTFDGFIEPVNQQYNLYNVTLTERKNCSDYNATNVPGYATITAAGALEFFLFDTGSLYYMIYTAAVTEAESTAATTTTTEDTATTAVE
ncbi:hypothetical protein [Candidatus Thalassolituus haligoni]|uniref:hypothetical protein n=1 Tax=Candidatus Thalassolituus haligoni TaxID=3100113 RepID=UPI003513BF19|tara:strand:- start:18966 stop:19805 length:840 start_codon:yes stop_codon:yes gene_type:complete